MAKIGSKGTLSDCCPRCVLLVSATVLNKRPSLYYEYLTDSGCEAEIRSLRPGEWDLSAFESDAKKKLFIESLLEKNSGPISTVFCFNWAMLYYAIFLKIVHGARIVYDEHDYYEFNVLEKSGIIGRLSNFAVKMTHSNLVKYCDLVACVYLKDHELLENMRSYNSSVLELNNYPTRRWFAKKGAQRNGGIKIVYLGGVWSEKGCIVLSELSENLKNLALPIELHIFGDGDLDLIRGLQSDYCTIYGRSSSNDIIDFLTTNRCLGLALYQSTVRYTKIGHNSRKIFEYMATGTPVVSTDVGMISELVCGNGGYVIGDSEQALNIIDIARTLLDEACWEAQSERGIDYLLSRGMTWEAEWSKLSGVIDCIH